MYIIEANPRASRTVPFVAKAIGHPLAAYASLLMSGQTLPEIGFTEEPTLNHVAVKEAVLPFEKFQGAARTVSSPLPSPFPPHPTAPALAAHACGPQVLFGACTSWCAAASHAVLYFPVMRACSAGVRIVASGCMCTCMCHHRALLAC